MKKINEGFVCINCGQDVPPGQKTCRNHCPYCFMSRHLDKKMPGDRKADCKGKMVPINYETSGDKIKILFECVDCGKKHKNKALKDDNLKVLDEKIRQYKKFI